MFCFRLSYGLVARSEPIRQPDLWIPDKKLSNSNRIPWHSSRWGCVVQYHNKYFWNVCNVRRHKTETSQLAGVGKAIVNVGLTHILHWLLLLLLTDIKGCKHFIICNTVHPTSIDYSMIISVHDPHLPLSKLDFICTMIQKVAWHVTNIICSFNLFMLYLTGAASQGTVP